MTHSPSPFDGSASADSSLQQAEKAGLWKAISAHMQANPAPDAVIAAEDEAAMEEFFLPATMFTLQAQEKEAVRHALLLERDAAAFFAPAAACALTEEEMLSGFFCLQDEAMAQSFFADAMDTELGKMERASVLASVFGGRGGMPPAEVPAVEPGRSWTAWLAPALAGVVLLAGGAGISSASDDALPGEFLYPFKQLNEHINRNLSFSTESRAETGAKHMERRMREAEALQTDNRLTEDLSLTIDQEFRRERRETIDRIEELESKGDTAAAARIRARLNAHEDGYKNLFRGRDRASAETSSSSSHTYPTIRDPADSTEGAAASATVDMAADASSTESSVRSRRRSPHSSDSSL